MQTAGYATASASVPANAAELDRRYGARVEAMLAHWLDDETLAAGLRRPVLAEVARNGGRFDPRLGSVEDWVFSEARREARALIGPEGVAGVIPVMRHTPDPGMLPRQKERRGGASRKGASRAAPRRKWLGGLAALVAAGAVLTVAWYRPSLTEWQVADLQPDLSRPPVLEPAPPPPAAAPAPLALPKLDAEAELGPLPEPDLAAILQPPEPAPALPSLAAPPPPAPPPALPGPAAGPVGPVDPPVAAAAPSPAEPPRPRPLRLAAPTAPAVAGRPMPVHAPPRVFIHYSALDDGAGARAQVLAQLVRDQGFEVTGMRAVPFQIGEPSVRYFFPDNAGDADALVEASRRIPQMAELARSGPTDFTHFQPKPQPGTLEIWLPAG